MVRKFPMGSRDGRVVSFFIPNLNGGGAQKVIVNLANQIVLAGTHTVHVVVGDSGGKLRGQLCDSVIVYDLNVKRIRYSVFPLLSYLANEKPDVLMSTMHYANILAVITRILARTKFRLVLREAEVYTAEHAETEISFFRIFKPLLIRIFYPASDHVIANSNATLVSLKKYGLLPENFPSTVIYNPIGPTACSPKKVHYARYGRYIIGIGRFSYEKGFDQLIRSFALLRDESLNLVLLGEGPLLPNLRELASDLGVSDRVHFPGFVDHVADYLSESQVFVLPSRWEGFGNVLVEALGAGVPVVAVDCPGGVREILEGGKHGFLVKDGDVYALSNAIKESLSQPVGTSRSRKSRAHDFRPEVIAVKYLKVLINYTDMD